MNIKFRKKNRHRITGIFLCPPRLVRLALIVLPLLFMGCGGSSGGKEPLEGKVIDGYIVNALVYQDLNGNEIWDEGEPYTHTDTKGDYSLVTLGTGKELDSIMVEIIPGETYDLDHPATPIKNICVFEVPIGYHILISPFTTLVTNWMDICSITHEEAEEEVRIRFDLSPGFDFNTDYIAASGEYVDVRSKARAIGDVMLALFGKIDDGLKRESYEEEMPTVTELVTWRIMQKSEYITEGVANGWTQEDLVPIVEPFEVTHESLVDIDFDIDIDLDVSSPGLMSRTPEPGDVVPCDTVVTFVFDEELDPAGLAGKIMLQDADGIEIPSFIGWDTNTDTLTLTPESPLYAMKSYTINLVGSAIVDTSGNTFKKTLQWSFQTNADISPPAPPVF